MNLEQKAQRNPRLPDSGLGMITASSGLYDAGLDLVIPFSGFLEFGLLLGLYSSAPVLGLTVFSLLVRLDQYKK